MATVKFTRHLLRYFPELETNTHITGATVADVVAGLDQRYSGLAAYLVDDQGALRKHVNIFLNQQLITDRAHLADPVGEDDQIHIFQALSGG